MDRILPSGAALAVAMSACGGPPSPAAPGPPRQAELGELPEVPNRKTPVAELSRPGHRHVEALRIDQDFHPDDAYEIALDAWVTADAPPELSLVRMWWMDTSQDDIRSPFGSGVRRHIDVRYERLRADAWRIEIHKGRRRFAFDVEAGAHGGSAVYGRLESNPTQRCAVKSGQLVAKKFLGFSVGLDRIEIECRDGMRGTLAE